MRANRGHIHSASTAIIISKDCPTATTSTSATRIRGRARYNVHQAHQQFIHPTPVVPGQQADDDAYTSAHSQSDRSDNERYAGAVNNAAQDVSPQLVRAENVLETTPGPRSRPAFHQDSIAKLRVRVLLPGLLQRHLVKELAALRHLHHQLLRGSRPAPDWR